MDYVKVEVYMNPVDFTLYVKLPNGKYRQIRVADNYYADGDQKDYLYDVEADDYEFEW